MTYEIRRVGPGDTALFDKIAPEVFDEPVLPDRLAAYLAEPSHHLIVAVADGQIVGQCEAIVIRHPDKLPQLYVDEIGTALGYRRRGMARAMLGAMMGWGRELGCADAWVGTEPDNGPARALYSSFRLPEHHAVFYEGDL